MSGRPLHKAFWVLSIGLMLVSLTALTLSQRPTPLLARAESSPTMPDSQQPDAAADAPVTPAIAATAPEADDSWIGSLTQIPQAAAVPTEPTGRPLLPPELDDVLHDGPRTPEGRFLYSATYSGSATERGYSRRLGYEELPAPPEYAATTTASAAGDLNPLAVAPPVVRPETPPDAAAEQLRELTRELTSLRSDLQALQVSASRADASDDAVLEYRLALLEERTRFEELRQELRTLADAQLAMQTELTERTPALPPSPPPEVTSDGSLIEIAPTPGMAGLWSARLHQADPALVVRHLSALGGWNLVLSRSVTGRVELTFTGVPLDKVLQGFAHALGCSIVEDGALLLIVPDAEAAERRRAAEQTIARLIAPQHLSPAQIEPLIHALLTPGLGTTAIMQAEGHAGPLTETPATLLVVDYPHVVAQVESLVREVDVAPAAIEIEAVMTTVRWSERSRAECLRSLAAEGLVSRRRGGSDSGCLGKSVCVAGSPREILARLEHWAETTVEALPTVRVLDRQSAELEIGSNVGYRDASLFRKLRLVSEEIEFLPDTTRLAVRPSLLPDGSIRLDVHPQLAHFVRDDGTGLPRQEIAGIHTQVSVAPGCTALIGGLTQTSRDAGTGQAWGGRLRRRFRNRGGNDVEEIQSAEVLILVSARRAELLPAETIDDPALPGLPNEPDLPMQPVELVPDLEYMPGTEGEPVSVRPGTNTGLLRSLVDSPRVRPWLTGRSESQSASRSDASLPVPPEPLLFNAPASAPIGDIAPAPLLGVDTVDDTDGEVRVAGADAPPALPLPAVYVPDEPLAFPEPTRPIPPEPAPQRSEPLPAPPALLEAPVLRPAPLQ